MAPLRLLLAAAAATAAAAAPPAARLRLPGIISDGMVAQANKPINIWGWASPKEIITVCMDTERCATAAANSAGQWRCKLPATPASGGAHSLRVSGSKTAKPLEVNDVLVGEVWVASGQSNMEMTLDTTQHWSAAGGEQQSPRSQSSERLRVFNVDKRVSDKPTMEISGKWVTATRENIGTFSAVAYFFGCKLLEELNHPVGVVVSAWGSTGIEAWTSLHAQREARDAGNYDIAGAIKFWEDLLAIPWDRDKAQEKYEVSLEAWERWHHKLEGQEKAFKKTAARKGGDDTDMQAFWGSVVWVDKPSLPCPPREKKNFPGNLFNGMISPLLPMSIRGVIWYQGERSARFMGYARRYGTQLVLLINDWRAQWGQPELPFVFVQLPGYFDDRKKPANGAGGAVAALAANSKAGKARKGAVEAAADDEGTTLGSTVEKSSWAVVRDNMRKVIFDVPFTGMAITIDVVGGMHAPIKEPVGDRLAAWCLAKVYKRKHITASGPVFRSQRRLGSKIVLQFNYTEGGLSSHDGKPLRGFAVAGIDRVWQNARADIKRLYDREGRVYDEAVVVSSPLVDVPRGVRYGWADSPDANLVNARTGKGDPLPASPFRTDNWPIREALGEDEMAAASVDE